MMEDVTWKIGESTMTIRVKIGPIEKDIADVDPSWIHEQISGRRDDEVPVCVQVTIDMESVDLIFATSDCARFGRSDISLSNREKEVVSLWNMLDLNDKNFTEENLLAFLRQIRQ
jgi:hypothetical protein